MITYLTAEVSLAVLSESILIAPSSSPSIPWVLRKGLERRIIVVIINSKTTYANTVSAFKNYFLIMAFKSGSCFTVIMEAICVMPINARHWTSSIFNIVLCLKFSMSWQVLCVWWQNGLSISTSPVMLYIKHI